MNNALIWFRRDLRLADNPALRAALAWAAERGARVLPVFVHDAEAGRGVARTSDAWADGGATRWWLHHSLHFLGNALRGRGSDLLIARGEPLATLRGLIRRGHVGAVFWNRVYEPTAIARDGAIEAALRENGVHVEAHHGALLHEPWSVATRSGGPYKVFTPFSRALAERPIDRPEAAPEALPPLPEDVSGDALDALGLLPTIPWDADMRRTWTPGEGGARGLLESFVDGPIAHYAGERDFPARPATSRLSPALHFGEISAREAWHAARVAGDEGGREGGEAWRRQLLWREFAHHLLYHFPHTPERPLDARYERFPWRSDATDGPGTDLAAWQRGETGIPIVDAGMRELWRTGWMHNRVRMLTASLLTKNLLIPWQAGALWFWDTLVDADLANNTLGWQWTAGCGADAAPYFRVFNPVTQGEKFDAEGRYVRRWLPALARLPDAWIHRPWAAPEAILRGAGVVLDRDYPRPIVDLAASRRAALDRWADAIRNAPAVG